MKVFVTGGTGALGPYVVRELHAAGHEVTVLARTPAKASAVEAMGATPSGGTLFDVDSLEGAFHGHDAVLNLATSIPAPRHFLTASGWRDNDRIRDAGSAAVAEAVRRIGRLRLVQESIAFNLADGGDNWVDEESALDPLGHGFSALAAERHATEVGGVALRFGLFYGPGSSHSQMLIDCARRHLGFVAGSPHAFQPAIHLHDAARATVAALSVPSGMYLVTDDEPLTRRDFVRALGDAVGVTRLIRAPGSGARLGGRYTHSLTRSHRTSNARFAAAAGWHPEYPSVREGWQATVATVSRRDS
ncbi:MAG: NAD(P)H-binding protein [Rhodococcus sp. (in: high G+C Gram-positive bacteria)]